MWADILRAMLNIFNMADRVTLEHIFNHTTVKIVAFSTNLCNTNSKDKKSLGFLPRNFVRPYKYCYNGNESCKGGPKQNFGKSWHYWVNSVALSKEKKKGRFYTVLGTCQKTFVTGCILLVAEKICCSINCCCFWCKIRHDPISSQYDDVQPDVWMCSLYCFMSIVL